MNKIILDDSKKLFLISDTHFCHKNIIKFASRPFSTTQEMDETIVNNWNSVVKDEDQIIFLGDFLLSVKDPIQVSEYIYECLNGIKTFIIGNHDERKLSPKINWVRGPIETLYRGHKLVLQHHTYSEKPVGKMYDEGYIRFNGHTHKPNSADDINTVNVCCETINYTPILFEECLRG